MNIYKIAGILIEMGPKHEPLLSQSKEYIYTGIIHDEEVNKIPEAEQKIINMREQYPHLSVGNCEYMVYGTYFYSILINNNGIMLHSSAVCYDNFAYLFSAPSGTGKSTHTSLWLKAFPGARILNDDKPAIVINSAGDIRAYGTPFSGKTDLNFNEDFAIKSICFLKRSPDNWIKNINSQKAISEILSQTLRPTNIEMMDKVLNIVERMVKEIKICEMGCNISLEAAKLAYDFMNEDN